jgi:CDGSH-type Zn-finger protein
MVRGAFVVLDAKGAPIATEEGGVVLLCRCGNSQQKPLCDGSHKQLGFKG